MSDEAHDQRSVPVWKQRPKWGSAGRPNMNLPKEVREERKKEQLRRSQEGKRRAYILLSEEYPNRFQYLVRVMRAQVEDERGPLPGDD